MKEGDGSTRIKYALETGMLVLKARSQRGDTTRRHDQANIGRAPTLTSSTGNPHASRLTTTGYSMTWHGSGIPAVENNKDSPVDVTAIAGSFSMTHAKSRLQCATVERIYPRGP